VLLRCALAALVLFLLVIGPQLEGNSLTSANTFRLATSAMVMLLTLAVAGSAVIGFRAAALPRYAGDRR
jgi:hypothetical protein